MDVRLLFPIASCQPTRRRLGLGCMEAQGRGQDGQTKEEMKEKTTRRVGEVDEKKSKKKKNVRKTKQRFKEKT